MVDLQINYDQLHQMASSARTLKQHLNDKVPGLTDAHKIIVSDGVSTYDIGDGADPSVIGNSALAGKLNKFHLAWNGPFKDAMSRLDDLAELLDGVATKFFDMDSDFAAKANNMLASLQNASWESKRNQHDYYERTKDLKFQPSPLWNKNGVLEPQAPVPLVNWAKPAEDAGPRPTHTNVPSQPTVTDTTYDDQGRVTSETSKVNSPSGLAYNETTSYTYDGNSKVPNGYSTTIMHSDGSAETIVQHVNPDGSFTVTDTMSKGTSSSPVSEGTSISTVTPKPKVAGQDAGYTAVTIDAKGNTSHTDVTNNPGATPDSKVVTDDAATRTYTGNADYDSWNLVAIDWKLIDHDLSPYTDSGSSGGSSQSANYPSPNAYAGPKIS